MTQTLRHEIGPGDAPRLAEPHPVTRQLAERIGLEFYEGHWYRLAGWGQPGNWSTERVFVPRQHAELMLEALAAKGGA